MHESTLFSKTSELRSDRHFALSGAGPGKQSPNTCEAETASGKVASTIIFINQYLCAHFTMSDFLWCMLGVFVSTRYTNFANVTGIIIKFCGKAAIVLR